MRDQRPFGATGLHTSPLGVGCSRLGGVMATDTSRRDEIDVVHAAVDAGVTFFDTSDLYSQGQSEALLGSALRHRRDRVVLATKGGYVVGANRRLVATIKPLVAPAVRWVRARARRSGDTGSGAGAASWSSDPIPQDFTPAHLEASLHASLRRLRTDRVDLYQLHSPPRSVIEAGEWVEVLERLKAQGKLLHYGIAADAGADVAGFDRLTGLSSLQLPFGLLFPEPATELLPRTAARGVAVVARSAFAAGLLDERLSDDELRARTPDAPRLIALRDAARSIGRPVLEAALLYSLGAPGVSVTIVGMRSRAHLADNLRLASAAPLGADERRALTAPWDAPT